MKWKYEIIKNSILPNGKVTGFIKKAISTLIRMTIRPKWKLFVGQLYCLASMIMD